MLDSIVGLPEAESDALIDELIGYLWDPDYLYEHHWRDGDRVIWDNVSCSVHGGAGRHQCRRRTHAPACIRGCTTSSTSIPSSHPCECPMRRCRSPMSDDARPATMSAPWDEPPSSSGLGRRPFKAVTGIRTPLGARRRQPERSSGPVVQFGVHAALSRRRPRVQIPSGPPAHSGPPGRVAQLAEHAPEKRGVTGSTPVPATIARSSATAPAGRRARRSTPGPSVGR